MHTSTLVRSIATALWLATCLTGCGGQDAPPPKEIVRPVKTFVFGAAERSRSYSYPGQVYANQTVEVAFEVTGKLQELPVSKGQAVRAGDLIARLDPRDFENEVRASRAALDQAIATRDRYRVAARTNAVSREEVDQAEALARISAADLKIKEKALEDTTILADFDGIVADRFVDNFQNVVAKQPVVLLQDIQMLEIRVSVPERDVVESADEPGRVAAVFDTLPDREFELSVKEFVTEADPVTQTYRIVLAMPNPEGAGLLPGMTATVRWYAPTLGSRGDNTVPLGAVRGGGGRPSSVWVIEPDARTVTQREVRLGQVAYADRVEILEGLEPGETIAAAGVHHLVEGMRVRAFGE
jgi:RND family efflux transporter MFP subunit